jgi:hypothetical protein
MATNYQEGNAMEATETYTDRFFHAYVECALWSSTDENGEPLDGSYGPDDLSTEALKSMREDCDDFIQGAENDLLALRVSFKDGMTPEQAGHDFWLTRNRHGAGFWDRGLGEVGDRLTAMAHPYGSSDLYVGDDGLIYVV